MAFDRATVGFEEAVWSREVLGPAEKGDNEGGTETAFRLNVENGGTVVATFPFSGNADEGQLSFQIGDSIVILEKDTQWSWGKLVRTGEEGWTPNNYVQSMFKPLPGVHELQMVIKIKKAREEAIERGGNPDEAEARIRREMEEGNQVASEGDTVVQQGGVDVGQGQNFGGAQDPNQLAWPGGMEIGGYNQIQGHNLYNQSGGYGGAYDPNAALGTGYGDPNNPFFGAGGYGNAGSPKGVHGWSKEGDVDMAFGMWMEQMGENSGSGGKMGDAADQDSQESHTDINAEERNFKREEVARKLLETEERYAKLLDALIKTIVKPCMGEGSRGFSPLTSQEANETFGILQTDEILSISQALKKQLSAQMKDYNDDTCFGDLFTRFIPFLKMYVQYCTQHDSSASRVGLMSAKNEKFQDLLKESSMDPRSMGLDVQSLLNLPLERIPQYRDLLEELQDNTDESHPDHKLLDKAIDEIADISNFIDESIKQRENQAKLLGVQAVLSDPNDFILEEQGKGRIYVKSGVMTKLGRRTDRKDYFALFTNSLLHAKKSLVGNKFIFNRLTEILRVEDVGFMKSKPKANHVFRVVTNGHIYLLEASSSEEKNAWMRMLQMVIHGAKRKQLYQGTLQVIRLDKNPPEIKQEYFYVFTDVVVKGKSLWRGKFKYKQTVNVERVEEEFLYNPHTDPPLPADLSSNIALSGGLGNCFRIVHSGGASILLLASSRAEKEIWLKALKKLLEYKYKIEEDTPNSRNGEGIDDTLDSDDDSSTPKEKPKEKLENNNPTPPTLSRKGGKKDNSSSKSRRQRKSNSTSQEHGEGDLMDLLSGETTNPSHSSARPPNVVGGSRKSEGGRREKSSLPQQNTSTQNVPATAADRLLTNDLAAVFATSATVQPSNGGGGYANHHQGGMPNYAQQQQCYPTVPDGTMYMQKQQQPVNAYPQQQPIQGYMEGTAAAYQGEGVGMQRPHHYQQAFVQQPVVQPMGGASEPIPMANNRTQQQELHHSQQDAHSVGCAGSQYQRRFQALPPT